MLYIYEELYDDELMQILPTVRVSNDFIQMLGLFAHPHCSSAKNILQVLGDGSKPWYLVDIKIAGKWMFIPLKMVLIGIDPYPLLKKFHVKIVCVCLFQSKFNFPVRKREEAQGCFYFFLVGGLEHVFIFHFIYGMSSFPLTFIFFKMVIAPPTSFQLGFLRSSCFSDFPLDVSLEKSHISRSSKECPELNLQVLGVRGDQVGV